MVIYETCGERLTTLKTEVKNYTVLNLYIVIAVSTVFDYNVVRNGY